MASTPLPKPSLQTLATNSNLQEDLRGKNVEKVKELATEKEGLHFLDLKKIPL